MPRGAKYCQQCWADTSTGTASRFDLAIPSLAHGVTAYQAVCLGCLSIFLSIHPSIFKHGQCVYIYTYEQRTKWLVHFDAMHFYLGRPLSVMKVLHTPQQGPRRSKTKYVLQIIMLSVPHIYICVQQYACVISCNTGLSAINLIIS